MKMKSPTLLVKLSCNKFYTNFGCVSINETALDNVVERYLSYVSDFTVHNESCHLLDGTSRTADYFIVLDTINFGSGFQNIDRKDNSTYFTIAAGLKNWFLSHSRGPSVRDVASLSEDDLHAIFSQDRNNHDARSMISLMASNLKMLTDYLIREEVQMFSDLFSNSNMDVDDIICCLIKTGAFEDVYSVNETKIYILKRAQILCQDLLLCGTSQNAVTVFGGEKLTCFADNLLPAVLFHDGVLVYSPELQRHIVDGKELPEGTVEEIAIRVCTVEAMEQIARRASRFGRIEVRQLDFALWNRGQELKKHGNLLRHFTHTTRY